MVEAEVKEVSPACGDTYTAYYCNLCNVAECVEDKKLVELGGLVAFGTSALVKKNYDSITKLLEKEGK